MLPSAEKMRQLLEKIQNIRLAVIGDACLDVYWWADMQRSQLSRETPHHNLPIVRETMSPGAAGNVAVNAASFGCASVDLISPVGLDWRGNALVESLNINGVRTSRLARDEKILTPAYIKPIRSGYAGIQSEDPRIDFAPSSPPPPAIEQALIDALDLTAQNIDVILVSDQLPLGCISEKIRSHLESISLAGKIVIVDSRDRIGKYKNMILKPNSLEGWRALNNDGDVYPLSDNASFNEYKDVAVRLCAQNRSSVCLTLGPAGCIWADDDDVLYFPACREEGSIDIVGAGDAFLAALGCSLAAGAKPKDALALGSIVSNVIIHKIGMTGTASPAEIIDRHQQLLSMSEPFMARYNLCGQKKDDR